MCLATLARPETGWARPEQCPVLLIQILVFGAWVFLEIGLQIKIYDPAAFGMPEVW